MNLNRIKFFAAPVICFFLVIQFSCSKKENPAPAVHGTLQLTRTRVGDMYLNFGEVTSGVPVDRNFVVEFSGSLDTMDIRNNIILRDADSAIVSTRISYLDNNSSVVLDPVTNLDYGSAFILSISPDIRGVNGETFPGYTYNFNTMTGELTIQSATINGSDFNTSSPVVNVSAAGADIELVFSRPLDPAGYSSFIDLSGTTDYSVSLSQDSLKVSVSTSGRLETFKKYYFTISSNLTGAKGFAFGGFSNAFYAAVDSVYKFPVISDDELLTRIQEQTFAYFWDYAHPVCGLARERLGSGDVVTIGGSGFGIMSLIVGVERGFITRDQALTRMGTILSFLETCDRFHGAWPHWLNGSTGKIIPFSPDDNGGDLVETSFMIQGLLTFRQYLEPDVPAEKSLIDRINALYDGVEYDFYSRGENALYWHWSPTNGWAINLKLQGYNETMICYVLGIGSPTHPIPAASYYQGYMNSGSVLNGNKYYGYVLPEGPSYGGPLFFTQYSFLGLNPQNLKGPYVDYWEQNVNHSLINWAYCADDPKNFAGYSSTCWGLTASDGNTGYSAHSPTNDLGVITPTAAISSIPYTPQQSMDAIHTFYYFLGDKLWGTYGFYDAFNPTASWYADSFLAIDEGPIIVMIENYRTGLLWNLFMSNPEITSALTSMGFTY